jgi:hypothetical protein
MTAIRAITDLGGSITALPGIELGADPLAAQQHGHLQQRRGCTARRRRSGLLDDPIAEYPDALDLQLDDVAGVEEPAQLEAAAPTYSARAQDLPWVQGL